MLSYPSAALLSDVTENTHTHTLSMTELRWNNFHECVCLFFTVGFTGMGIQLQKNLFWSHGSYRRFSEVSLLYVIRLTVDSSTAKADLNLLFRCPIRLVRTPLTHSHIDSGFPPRLATVQGPRTQRSRCFRSQGYFITAGGININESVWENNAP